MTTFTAIAGYNDTLKDQPLGLGNYVAFVDYPARDQFWEIRKLPRLFCDANRDAKIVKVMAHNYIDDDYSFWIDASVELHQPPEDFLEFMDPGYDMVLLRHPGSIYDEGRACLDLNKDTPEAISQTLDRYREMAGSHDWEMAQGNLILRKHCPEVENFNRIWWDEILNGSKRDQLSLPYALKASGVRWKFFDFDPQGRNKMFNTVAHL